ncbi:hypothetical protein CEXT_158701 [Caerostris extrusa]|uniref:Uncharacterized protein n=1 Tax=Caerostris extrusa TaxID=172846 RepID=A0AAV4UKJ3_CAEEX|nr:hypothetical protein CEXT_158701 [Caerostris extrusa]
MKTVQQTLLYSSSFAAKDAPLKSPPINKNEKNFKSERISFQHENPKGYIFNILNNENQHTNVKSSTVKNLQNLRRKGNRPDLSQNEKTNKEIKTWVSSNTLQPIPVNTETEKVSYSEEEDDISASICSSEESFWTTDFSNNEIGNFSNESGVTKEDSMISSKKVVNLPRIEG